MRKFLAEIQGCYQPPSSTKSETTVRHLNGVSPTRYRQNHIHSTIHCKKNSLNGSEEPQVSCFHEDMRERSEARCSKHLQLEEESQPTREGTPENLARRFSQNRQEIICRNSQQIGERISQHTQERFSQKSSEQWSQSENTLNAFPIRSKTTSISESSRTIASAKITSLENTLQCANNMIRALERQLDLKNMKIKKMKENSETKDQQIEHYKVFIVLL